MTTLENAASRPLSPSLGAITDRLAPFADPLVRATAGLFLVPHGAQKLFGWFGGYGLEATSQYFATKLGMPASFALIAGLIEFAGGILLAIGFLTRPVAALVAGLLLVAAQVHIAKGFFWSAGGYEYPVFWAIVAIAYVLRGGGRYSVDAAIGREI